MRYLTCDGMVIVWYLLAQRSRKRRSASIDGSSRHSACHGPPSPINPILRIGMILVQCQRKNLADGEVGRQIMALDRDHARRRPVGADELQGKRDDGEPWPFDLRQTVHVF